MRKFGDFIPRAGPVLVKLFAPRLHGIRMHDESDDRTALEGFSRCWTERLRIYAQYSQYAALSRMNRKLKLKKNLHYSSTVVLWHSTTPNFVSNFQIGTGFLPRSSRRSSCSSYIGWDSQWAPCATMSQAQKMLHWRYRQPDARNECRQSFLPTDWCWWTLALRQGTNHAHQHSQPEVPETE